MSITVEGGTTVEVVVNEDVRRVDILVTETPINVDISVGENIAAVPGPAGPPGPEGPAGGTLTRENVGLVTIRAGQPVAKSPTGTGLVLASDITAGNLYAVGIAVADADPGFPLTIQTEGPLELLDWSAATGGVTLPANTIWSLGVGGNLQSTPTSTSGEFYQQLGTAEGGSTLIVRIAEPVYIS